MALGVVHPSGLTPTRLWELLRWAGIQRRCRTIPKSTCGTVLRQLRAAGIACSTSARGQTAVLDSRAVWPTEQGLRNNRLHRFQRALVPDLPT